MKPVSNAIPPLTEEQVAGAAEILRLMGEASRLRILLACLTQPGPVGEIAARVGIPRSLVSHHLRLLRASRLLRAEKNGKQVIYSPLDERVRCIVVDLAAHVLEMPEDREAADE
jgi:DNA-binding transcriptional ArsR family regulator